MKLVKDTDNKLLKENKVSDQEAEEAFKTILTFEIIGPNGRINLKSISFFIF